MSAKVLRHPRIARAFDGAAPVAALGNWITAAVPPDVDIHAGLRALRQRSRDAAQNEDHMKAFLRAVEVNLIGDRGIHVEPRPRLASGKPDRFIKARLDDLWAQQCKRGTWDATGQLSRISFAQLGARTVATDGEVLIRIHDRDPESPTGFSVELYDAEALDIDYNAVLPGGNVVRMGVEMTKRRRPVAYHVFAESVTPGAYRGSYAASERLRVPADQMLHVFLPQWVWGTRGVPWAHTALRRIKMLGGYEEAAITAARLAAAKSAKYVSGPDVAPGVDPNGAWQEGRFVQEIEPGAIEQVPAGWDLEPLDWQWPNTDHGVFVKAALRSIFSGLGVNYNTAANDLEGVNYSSLRSGALSERDMWKALQTWWIEWVEEPLYTRWCTFVLADRQVRQRGGEGVPLERIPALSRATFQGRRWPWVDPLKDLQAAETAVRLRTRSISSIIRESGDEPDEVWEELQDDLALLAKLGIPYVPAAGASGGSVASASSPAAAGAESPAAPADAAEPPEGPESDAEKIPQEDLNDE